MLLVRLWLFRPTCVSISYGMIEPKAKKNKPQGTSNSPPIGTDSAASKKQSAATSLQIHPAVTVIWLIPPVFWVNKKAHCSVGLSFEVTTEQWAGTVTVLAIQLLRYFVRVRLYLRSIHRTIMSNACRKTSRKSLNSSCSIGI